MSTLVIRLIHCRVRLNVTFFLQVLFIVDVRLAYRQLWKKCFKNILYSDRRVSNLPPVLPGDIFLPLFVHTLVNQTLKKKMHSMKMHIYEKIKIA